MSKTATVTMLDPTEITQSAMGFTLDDQRLLAHGVDNEALQ